ncbi:MAG: hypothetical protein EOO40_08550 [Deltaproteobacteria bacterium]|nr:MAG: hypothetical protein EOO40_08550 [Deltaproteobacteria bacterium]
MATVRELLTQGEAELKATLQKMDAAAAESDALQPMGLGDVRGGDVKGAAKEAWGTLQPLVLGELQWSDKGGRVTAATCLPRVKAYIAVKDALKSLDTQVSEALAAATSAVPASAEKRDHLARTWRRLQVREAAAAMLRTINVSGLGQRGPHSLSDLAAAANPMPKPPRLAVSADGPYWLGLANALVDGTRSAGVVPALAAVAPTYDLHLTATVTLAAADSKGRTGKNIESATASVVLHLQDMRAGKVLLHETYTAKGSASSNVFDAERAAMRAVAQTAVQATRSALLGHAG